jgi:hypothetical protein
MSKFQISLLIIVGIVVGSVLGTIGVRTIQNRSQSDEAENSKLDQIKEMSSKSDEDFINSYNDFKNSLSVGEKILGDRLYSCLSENQSFETEIEEMKTGTDEDPNRKKSFIERFLGEDKPKASTSNIPAGNLLPYAKVGKNVAPLEVIGARYMELFPNAKFQHPDEENFGVESSAVDDVNDYLKKKVCLEPAFSVVSQERKDQSKFFEIVKSNYFKGSATIFTADPKDHDQKLKTQVQFNSPTHDGFDYIEVKNDKDIFEQRVINPEINNEAWRYNTCQPSVVLLSDRCPWNDKFVYEFKDFYYVPDSKKMIGNIYCKGVAETRWTQMGTFELGQTSDDGGQ